MELEWVLMSFWFSEWWLLNFASENFTSSEAGKYVILAIYWLSRLNLEHGSLFVVKKQSSPAIITEHDSELIYNFLFI